MVLRSTRIAPTVLTQVGHEGNPTQTEGLAVTGTLDGTPALSVAAYKASDDTVAAASAPA